MPKSAPAADATGAAGTDASRTDATNSSAITLIDASALIALLGAEPAAGEVEQLLNDGAAMTTLNLAEAIDRLKRRYDLQVERTRPVIEGLLAKNLTLLALGPAQAWRAGEIRAAHYHRSRCPISLADAVLLASTPPNGRIASSDGVLLAVAASEGIATVVLQDSTGRRASVQ
jgi:PIN domain nuclease of toxin-antitoxin system